MAGCPRCHQAHCVLVHCRQSWCHMRRIHLWSNDQYYMVTYDKENFLRISKYNHINLVINSLCGMLQMLALVSICAHVGWMGWWLEHVHPHHRNNNTTAAAAEWTTIQLLRFAMFVCPSTPADKWSTETLFVSSDKSIKASSRALGSIGNDSLGNSKPSSDYGCIKWKLRN